jgi:hypothetical protein
MGMFDYVRSSYDLGEQFTNVELHTKDIEDGIGGTMSQYWIDPHGYLYRIDYSYTADFVELKEGDDGYDDQRLFLNFQFRSNGNKGTVTPHMITKYVEVYPSTWNGEWEDWPRCVIHFKYGRLMDFESYERKDKSRI